MDIQIQSDTLLDLVNSAYTEIQANRKGLLSYSKVEDFISNDANAENFIKAILQDPDYQTPNEESELYEIANARARHSAITFLIGLVFIQWAGFKEALSTLSSFPNPSKSANNYNDIIRLWMITALYHDYGYFVGDVKKGEIDLRKDIKYYLLDDSYQHEQLSSLNRFSHFHKDAMAFTYDEITAYDRYARKFHLKKKHEEKIDHGILGGVRIFNRLITRELNGKFYVDEREQLVIKTSCLAIAQHNIFKSDSKEADKAYGSALKKLHSTSNFRINPDTPLLLLLSLVDTFECVKKLSKGKNKRNYIQAKTVLSSIRLSISPEKLEIDFSELGRRVQAADQGLQKNYADYKKILLDLKKWTSFYVDKDDSDETIIIGIPNFRQHSVAAGALNMESKEI